MLHNNEFRPKVLGTAHKFKSSGDTILSKVLGTQYLILGFAEGKRKVTGLPSISKTSRKRVGLAKKDKRGHPLKGTLSRENTFPWQKCDFLQGDIAQRQPSLV